MSDVVLLLPERTVEVSTPAVRSGNNGTGWAARSNSGDRHPPEVTGERDQVVGRETGRVDQPGHPDRGPDDARERRGGVPQRDQIERREGAVHDGDEHRQEKEQEEFHADDMDPFALL